MALLRIGIRTPTKRLIDFRFVLLLLVSGLAVVLFSQAATAAPNLEPCYNPLCGSSTEDLEADDYTVSIYDLFFFEYGYANTGDSTAVAHDITYYLDTDTDLTNGGYTTVYQHSRASLDDGYFYTNTDYFAPPLMDAGTRYLCYWLDSGQDVDEGSTSDENDNDFCDSSAITVRTCLSDSFDDDIGSGTDAGESTSSAYNIGSPSSSTYTYGCLDTSDTSDYYKFYHSGGNSYIHASLSNSNSGVFGSHDFDLRLLDSSGNTLDFSGVGGSNEEVYSSSNGAPAAAGWYYLKVERYSGYGMYDFEIESIDSPCDLEPSGGYSSPSSSYTGDSVTFHFSVDVDGPGDAGPSSTRIYLSTDTNINPNYDAYIGSYSHGWLSPGTHSFSTSLTIPSGLSPDLYYWGVIVDGGSAVDEENEGNNVGAFNQFTVLEPPFIDLFAVGDGWSSGPSNAEKGEDVPLEIWIGNDGNTASGWFYYGIYLSLDTDITENDILVDEIYHPSISADTPVENNINVQIPSSINSDLYYWGLIVDTTNRIDEDNENNNDASFGSVSISDVPTIDLVPSSYSSGPSSAEKGDTISLDIRIDNDGNTASSGFYYKLYLSMDTDINSGDTLLGSQHYVSGGISSGSFISASVSVNIPTTISSRTYYWGIIVDTGSDVDEGDNEGNNDASFGSVSISDAPTIDLVPSISGPTSASPGDTVTLTVQIDNDGNTASSGFYYKLYLSMDTDINSGDTLLGSQRSVSGISSGSHFSDTVSVNIPTTISSNTYYWGIIVDTGSNIDEDNEDNNVASFGSVSISDAPTIDLVPSISGPTSASPGDTVTLTVQIDNDGNSASSGFYYKLYLSTDTNINSGDTLLGSQRSVSGISSGSHFSDTVSVNIPTTISSNTYYWGIIVDTGSNIDEDNEDNNIASFGSVSITETDVSTVDLVPSILGSSGPTSASPGDTVTLTVQVDNQGNSASGASGYRIYLSPDVDIDLDDIVLIGSSFPAIAGGDYWSLETEATVPASTSSGDYYWGIIVDINEYVDEEDEGNNAASFGYVTIGESGESEVPVPQLEVEVLSVAPDAAAFGDSFQVLVRVSNVGGGSTGTIDYEIFLSIDSTLSSPDVKIGEGTVPESLSEGEAWSGTKSATATSFYGEGQFYVIVRMTPWGYEDAGDWDAGDRIYLISGGSGGLGEDDSSESSSGDFLPVASVLGLIILVGVIIIGSVMRARTGSQSVVLPAFSRDDAETRTSSPRPRRTGPSGPPPPRPMRTAPSGPPPPTDQERVIAELKAKVSELQTQSNLPEDESPDIEAALRAILDEEKSPDVDDKALAGESESADSQDGNGSVEGVDEASRAKFCSQCGCTVGSDSKFCPQCGNMI